MIHLFFDTETDGLPINYRAPVSDVENWPRMVQVAWVLDFNNGLPFGEGSAIIKPDGFVIPEAASKIHGITQERAEGEGVGLIDVMRVLGKLVAAADILIAHNMAFDGNIIGAEFLRCEMGNLIPARECFCTMESFKEFVGIKNSMGFKWPKLSELHKKIFDTDLEGAHNALFDVRATAKCYWEMKKRGR